MKKLLYFFISILMIFNFVGCANKEIVKKDFKIKNNNNVKIKANKAWQELDKEN